MKKKVLSLGMAALLFFTALSGCGKATDSKVSNMNKEDKVKIRFASWDVAEDVDKQQALVDKFNESHENIEVVLEAYGQEFDTKISAGMGSKDAPDVMYMWNYPAYNEGLLPLDDLIAKEGVAYKDNFYKTLWDYNSMNGKIYGIPVGFTTHALYYNKDLFDKAGVAYPTDDWTYEDLKMAAKTISEKTDAKGFSIPMKPDPYDFEMFLWSNNASYCDKDGNKEGFINSDKAKSVVSNFQSMIKDGVAIATEKSGSDEFRQGSTAMFIYGSWAISSLDEDKVNYGIAKLPKIEGPSISILSSSGLSISKDTKNPEAAFEFVKYWTGEECNKARIGQELPVLNTVVQAEKIMEKEKFAPFYKMLEQSAGHTPASFIIKNWSEVSEKLELSFEEIFNSSSYADINTVLDEAAK